MVHASWYNGATTQPKRQPSATATAAASVGDSNGSGGGGGGGGGGDGGGPTEECGVCLERYQPSSESTLTCGHGFCTGCMNSLSEVSCGRTVTRAGVALNCPLCRRDGRYKVSSESMLVGWGVGV